MPASRADRTLSCAANWKARRRALLVRRSIRATVRSRSADDSDSRPAVRIPFRQQQRRHDRLQHLPRPDTRLLLIHEIVHQQIKNRPIRRLMRSRLPLTPSLPSTNASQSNATLSQTLFERKTKGRDFPALYWRVGALLRGGPSGRLVETCPIRYSDGASTRVDPRETAHVIPSEAPTSTGTAGPRKSPPASGGRLRCRRVPESRGPPRLVLDMSAPLVSFGNVVSSSVTTPRPVV